ncbi:MAG: asparagine synthase (glutamine-hydrolyzing) [Anaerolineales bacterium]|nr:asparagine synthase (glutamine-hydrolyzing) [Anaerolineales bacterium]
MCGIAGIAGPKATLELAQAMVRSVAHRGPDGAGVHQDGQTFIGQTRLSIIDLVTGDQPMPNEDQTIWVVFNGEIYNFPDLRRDLEAKGHNFRSTSDTEVLLHGYEEYGLDLLPKLDGIFAFAIWDAARQRLLLVRDYFGVKPLHYHFDGQTLRFGSEIKAILQDNSVPRQINFQGLHYFLNLRYIPGEQTLLAGIKRLPAAHYMLFENGRVHIDRYYTLKVEKHSQQDEAYFIEGIRHYLSQAVRKQLISDVPLGVYLSGGLDSSAIVAFMSELIDEPVKTFSLGFNEPTDELDDAQVVATHFSTCHQSLTLAADPLQRYPEVIWHAEEPKENILQGYLLAQFARQHVKVVHGGLGGDELFAGYAINRFVYPTQTLHHFVPNKVAKSALQPLSRLAFVMQNKSGLLQLDEYRRGAQMLLSLGDPEQYYLILRNTWDYDQGAFANLYGPALNGQQLDLTHTQFDAYFKPNGRGVLDQVLWAEFHTKMVDDFLMNEDRTSMAHGLEVRVPFLDRDLVRFALGIPVELKIKNNQTKYIFRKAMAGILPEHAVQKKKWGFTFNPYYQFQKDLKTVAERVLTRRRVEARGWFNYDYLRRILDHPPHPRLRWHYFMLWLGLGLEIWAQMFLESAGEAPLFDLEAYYDQ